MKLICVNGSFSVCKLSALPPLETLGEPVFMAKTKHELSLVCRTEQVPNHCAAAEHGWRAMYISGTLDFSLTGILSRLAGVLAEQNIPVFAVSTYDTDYLLIKETFFVQAKAALTAAGYQWSDE